MGTLSVAVDLIRARRQGRAGIEARQQRRLIELVDHARANSRYYQRLYAGLIQNWGLTDLPPVTKQKLMASFDDWVCDPRVTLAGVQAFVAGEQPPGTPFLGRYFVCSTSAHRRRVRHRQRPRVLFGLGMPGDGVRLP